jgi:hypothetical protein
MERQSQFKYQKAEITSDRLSDFTVDIRPLIVELVFYENLDKPYVTGQVAISDDQAVFDSLQFSGTDRMHIKMMSEMTTTGTDQVVMDRSFILTGIDNIIKSSNSGNSSIYLFSFMDEHAFISKTKHVSRSIQDDLRQEILKLCQNECGKNVDLSYSGECVQNNFKGIIPYMHPLEAASWLTSKATTEIGMPFYLYASIHDQNLRLASLDVMLQQDAWNKDIPYIYSPANTQKQEAGDGNKSLQYFQVQSMKATKLQNTLQQMGTGSIGARVSVTDISSGRTTAQHFDMNKTLLKADELGIIDYKKQNVYDQHYRTPDFKEVNIEGNHIHNMDAAIFHGLVSRGVYMDRKSIHDEVSPSMFLKNQENIAYRNAVYKNMIDITVPGPGFIASGGSVGDRIRVNVLNDDNNPDAPDQLDALKSGDFIVYNTRHTFRDTRHDVAMTIFKLERGPNVD